jgi:hypothetical protein
MKVTLEVDLEPFTVPNFVRARSKPGRRDECMQELPCYPLSDMDSNTLDKLCRVFRDEVFKKAGKGQPPQDTQP